MYCKNCGQSIAENSKFCTHCGTLQRLPEISTKNEISNPQTIQILKNIFGFNISKQNIGFYLVWVLLHIILLLTNWKSNDYSSEKIWPFSEYSELKHYDLTEFLLYTVVPLILIIIINLFKEPKKIETENLSLKYDMSFERDTTPTIIGVFIIILYLIFYILIAKGNDYNTEVSGIFSVIFLVLRIFITIWVINIAKKLNRDKTNWGFLAFFFPSLSLIAIGLKRKYKNNS